MTCRSTCRGGSCLAAHAPNKPQNGGGGGGRLARCHSMHGYVMRRLYTCGRAAYHIEHIVLLAVHTTRQLCVAMPPCLVTGCASSAHGLGGVHTDVLRLPSRAYPLPEPLYPIALVLQA
jgi:hypothetical protein